MPGRDRGRSKQRLSGHWLTTNYPVPQGAGFVPSGFSTCQDVTGDGDCHGFIVQDLEVSGGVINRPSTGFYDVEFVNYIADGVRSNAFGEHVGGVVGVPDDVTAATKAAAMTNPSRPYVDLPVNFLDIKTKPGRILEDLRDMRGRGFWRAPPRPSARELANGMGSAWLEYQFMIAPIVGDLVKMANLNRVVHDRIREIERLFGDKGLRRTVDVHAGSAYEERYTVLQSAGAFVSANARITTTSRTRVHCRWIPSGTGPRPAHEQMRAWAIRSALGLTVDASTLWEITPWSWMADWCSNLGDYFKATRNIVPAILMGVYPMTHVTTTWEIPPMPITAWWGAQVGAITATRSVRTYKSRRSSFVAPTFSGFPFLDGGRMGILAALVASRS